MSGILRLARAIDAFLFDFDGTLAPNLDLPGMRRQVLALTLQAGVPSDEVASLYSVEMIDRAAAWLRERNGDADEYAGAARDLIRRIELDAARTTTVFEGVRELFRTLRAKRIATGIVTRNCADAVALMFPDALDHCDVLVARDHVQHLKPDVRHVQRALADLGCPAGATAIVGDGAIDMTVGKELGLFCVGVLSGGSNRDRLEAAGADLVLRDVTRLLA